MAILLLTLGNLGCARMSWPTWLGGKEPAPAADADAQAADASTTPEPIAATPEPPAPTSHEAYVNEMADRSYPADAELGADLDIVVRQHRDRLSLSNRTPRRYADVQLWINQQYVADVASIEIGNGNQVLFENLINRHREHYPTPGFLTPDRYFPVHLAELYVPQENRRHRLLVQR